MESILTSIKKLLGISEEQSEFDIDVIMHINSVLMDLTQLGVGPATGFSISSDEQKWSDFLGTATNLEAAKTYVYLKVKLIFDPPPNSTTVKSMEELIKEYASRLNMQAEMEV